MHVVGEKTLRPLRYWVCRSLGASHWLAIKGLGLRWTLVVFFLALFGLYFHIQRLTESFFVVQKKKWVKRHAYYSNSSCLDKRRKLRESNHAHVTWEYEGGTDCTPLHLRLSPLLGVEIYLKRTSLQEEERSNQNTLLR